MAQTIEQIIARWDSGDGWPDEIPQEHPMTLTRADLRIRPKSATLTEEEVEVLVARRNAARAANDFATADAIRDQLAVQGVEVMDGDPLGWEWKLV